MLSVIITIIINLDNGALKQRTLSKNFTYNKTATLNIRGSKIILITF